MTGNCARWKIETDPPPALPGAVNRPLLIRATQARRLHGRFPRISKTCRLTTGKFIYYIVNSRRIKSPASCASEASMRLADDDRLGGRAPRFRSSKFEVRSSECGVGFLGQPTWRDTRRSCTESARLCEWPCQNHVGSLSSPERAQETRNSRKRSLSVPQRSLALEALCNQRFGEISCFAKAKKSFRINNAQSQAQSQAKAKNPNKQAL